MTLEEQVADLILDTAREWLTYAELAGGWRVRCEWHNDDEGETLHIENQNAGHRSRFAIKVSAKQLPPLPPIGPENDSAHPSWMPDGKYCADCDHDTHRCGGCGEAIAHDQGSCDACAREHTPAWVERTMADVRSGDTIRMVGREETRREVAGALHVSWHVADPSAAGSAEQARDIQYNPNRYQQRWSEIRLAFIDGGKYSFDPMMNVEIWLSPSEVAAIEMIGWEHRMGLAARNADES